MRSQRAVWGLILNAASLRMFVRNKFPFLFLHPHLLSVC